MARPIGLAPWNPTGESAALIDQVHQVLAEYRDFLPMTGRQIFYRLVGAHGYKKDEPAYKRLLERLVRARRAGLIQWDAIRDDGVTTTSLWGYRDPDEFIGELRESASGYQRHPREGQPYHVEVWVEANGMVPQVDRVVRDYGVTVLSSGGFNSVTMKYEAARRARRVAGHSQPMVVLHVGDHDPSGVAIFENLAADVRAITEDLGYIPDERLPIFERIAVTVDQAEEHDIDSAPPKATDTRSVTWTGETYQAEALPPDELAQIVVDAVEQWVDLEVLADLRAREETERDALIERLEAMEWDG